jgi:hypothetical protein
LSLLLPLLLLLLLPPHLQVQVWVVSLLLSHLTNMLEQRQGLHTSSHGSSTGGPTTYVRLPACFAVS